MSKEHRMEQVDELMRNYIAEYISKELELPEDCFVTITKVKTTPDLKEAIVYTSVLPYDQHELVINILNKVHGRIQNEISGRIEFKHTPKLTFELDNQEEKASKIDDLLDEIDKEL